MLHRYSSHHQSVAAAAPTMAASTTFSLFFPLTQGQWSEAADEASYDHSSITASPSSSSTGSVDCTLSLGTPSSRRAVESGELAKLHVAPPAYPSVSWDVAADQSSYYCQQGGKPAGGAAKGAMACAGQDLLLDHRCANCGTSSTPLWRNGPRGPKSLCNACGIRFKKEERRAAAMESGAAAAGCGYSAQRAHYEYASAAAAKASPGAVSYAEGAFPCGGDPEGAFPCGGDAADANAPFLAWRLNVVAPATAPAFAVWPERASLFQYN